MLEYNSGSVMVMFTCGPSRLTVGPDISYSGSRSTKYAKLMVKSPVPTSTVMAAVPLTEVSNVEVARTVKFARVSAAATVRRPAGEIVVPVCTAPSIVQVTSCVGLLVPATVAVNGWVSPLLISAVEGFTVTPVTVGISTVTAAVPLTEVSNVEVARTVKFARVSAAAIVRRPAGEIVVPVCTVPSIVQVTSCVGVLVPATAAVNIWVSPLLISAVKGLTVTLSTVGISTVTVAVPLTEELNVEVARTVSVVRVSLVATVRRPTGEIVVPVCTVPSIVQVTSCGGPLVPATVAVNDRVSPLLISVVEGLTVTPVTVGISTVTAAVPLTEVSNVEIARTVKLARVSSAATVRRPAGEIVVPVCTVPSIVQVTSCVGLLVPATVAVNDCVPPLATSAVEGFTVTLSTVGISTVTVAVPLTEELNVEVARIVSVVRVSLVATVRRPAGEIVVPACTVPSIAQVTSCGGPLVPATVAVKGCVPPLATSAVEGLTVTPVTVVSSASDVSVGHAVIEIPITAAAAIIPRSFTWFFTENLLLLRCHLLPI